MADISTELHDVEQAKYGREVRGSIYTALEKMNENINDFDVQLIKNAALVVNASNKEEICGGDIHNLPVNTLYTKSGATEFLNDPFPGSPAVVISLSTATSGHRRGDHLLAMYNGKLAMKMYSTQDWIADWTYPPVQSDIDAVTAAMTALGESLAAQDIIPRGTLTESDDLNDYITPGMWMITAASYPAHIPLDPLGNPAGIGRLIVFGTTPDVSTRVAGKVQLYITLNRERFLFRVGKADETWADWRDLSRSGTGIVSTYVAFGASTTEGRGTGAGLAPRPYPWYVAHMGNFDNWENNAHGGTGIFYRNGESYDDNIMDAVCVKSAESTAHAHTVDLLQAADLITINIGYNDRHGASTGGHGVDDFAGIYDNLIGSASDYFSYDRDTMYAVDHSDMDSATDVLYGSWGVDKGQGGTIAGGWNYILNYITNHFPQAQIVLVMPLDSYDELKSPTIDRSAHTITYEVRNTAYWYGEAKKYEREHPDAPYVTNEARSNYARCLWSDKVLAVVEALAANANVPIVDPNPAYCTALHAYEDKYNTGSHPTLAGYDPYSKAIASCIIAKYRN